jgi:hypothetical protein
MLWLVLFRGRPLRKQRWSGIWIWMWLGMIFLPPLAAAFFPSISGGDAFYFGVGLFNFLIGVWIAGIALCPWIPFEKTNDPRKPRTPAAALLVRAGCVCMSPFLIWLGYGMIGDFLTPAMSAEGRVERMYLRQGKYGTYGHIQINGRDHQASTKAYASTKVGALVNAEVGAASGHIYRIHPR